MFSIKESVIFPAFRKCKECFGTMLYDGGDRFSGNQSAGSITAQEEPSLFMEEMINMR